MDNLKASYVTNKAEVDRALTDVNRKIEEHSLSLKSDLDRLQDFTKNELRRVKLESSDHIKNTKEEIVYRFGN